MQKEERANPFHEVLCPALLAGHEN